MKQKHIIWKAFWNFEKEEEWINKMSSKGLALVHFFWIRYEFEEEIPGKYNYRIEFLKKRRNHRESHNYLSFIEELDTEVIGTYLYWVILRRKAKDGSFDIYTDFDSKIDHYKRVARWFFIFFLLELGVMVFSLASIINDILLESFDYIELGTLVPICMILFFTIYFLFLAVMYYRKARNLFKKKIIYES